MTARCLCYRDNTRTPIPGRVPCGRANADVHNPRVAVDTPDAFQLSGVSRGDPGDDRQPKARPLGCRDVTGVEESRSAGFEEGRSTGFEGGRSTGFEEGRSTGLGDRQPGVSDSVTVATAPFDTHGTVLSSPDY